MIAQEKLNEALNFHNTGQIEDARAIYKEILDEFPDNDSVLYFMGITSYQTGNLEEAAELITTAVKINPQPDYLRDLGNILFDLNKVTDAAEYFELYLKLIPDDIEIMFNLGLAYLNSGNFDESIRVFEQVLSLNNQDHEAFNSLGVTYYNKKELEKASNCFNQAIILNPAYSEAYNNLGNVYKESGNFINASNCYKKAIELNPNATQSYINLGICCKALGLPDEDISCFLRAVELNPNCGEAYLNLGFYYEDKFLLDEAAEYYEKVIALAPELEEAHIRLGGVYLLKREFEKGWKELEWRKKISNIHKAVLQKIKAPLWEGQDLQGKTLYVYREQGLGDSIHFARYLPLIAEKAGKVLFKPFKGMEKLFKDSNLNVEILNSDIPHEQVKCDFTTPIMSFSHFFKTNFDNVPFSDGYLKADKEKVKFYKEKFFNNDDFKLGIVWNCKNQYARDKFRSLTSVSYFYDFARMNGVKVYSLQKGEGEKELENMPEGVEIINLASAFNDFSDTAAAIENLDLLITIDTSVLHLAGALGKKTWLVLHCLPEWRWLTEIDYTPWYDSVKIFRQKELENWNPVFEQMKKEFKVLLEAKS